MFKKITAIGASVLMVGMTMGVAAAAASLYLSLDNLLQEWQ